MAFGGMILTNKGREALTRAQLGGQLKFTGIAVGDGSYHGSYNDRTALSSQLAVLDILKADMQDNLCMLEADLSNAGITEGYYLREIGILAESGGETVLYAYTNVGDDAEYIPAGNGAVSVEKRLRFSLIAEGVEDITFAPSSVLYVAQQDFEEAVQGIRAKTDQFTAKEAGYLSGVTSKIQTQLVGKAPVSHASAGTAYGISTAQKYGHAKASSTVPALSSGNGYVGSETAAFARGDHVHPSASVFAYCSTDADVPEKEISVNGFGGDICNKRICVCFEKGNTCTGGITLTLNGFQTVVWPEYGSLADGVGTFEPYTILDLFGSAIMEWNILARYNAAWLEDLKGRVSDLEGQVTDIEGIVKNSMEKLEVTLNNNYLWIPTADSISMEQEPGDCQCTDVLVDGGKKYLVKTCYSPSGISEGHLIYAANRIGSHYDFADIQEIPVALKGGQHEYVVTVPEGCNCLLVNNDDYLHGIEIYSLGNGYSGTSGSASSGMKILWSGLLKGGYDASTNDIYKVDFSIPQDCFFNDGRELVLAVNGFCPNDEHSTFPLLMTGMCFGAIGDFENVDCPYKGGDFSRYIIQEETYATGSGSGPENMVIEIHVKKVPDSRYAVCTVMNRSSHFYITSISAVLAG